MKTRRTNSPPSTQLKKRRWGMGKYLIRTGISIVVLASTISTITTQGNAVTTTIPFSYEYILPKQERTKEYTLFDMTSEKDRKCLIQNIYFESRGESHIGQAAVAWVTLNRVSESMGEKTICDVVYQKSQFNWTKKFKGKPMDDEDALADVTRVADIVLRTYYTGMDPTEGSTFFHSIKETPSWTKSFERIVKIDSHIFYRDNG
jgi:spore germination cell wall hydrolase CwlJ-like protein